MTQMLRKRSYRDLVVWQRAINLVPEIYELLKPFPKHEDFALVNQIRRAVVSIPANIAEGQARQHPKEFRQFLSIARGSLAELHTLLVVANRLGYISEDQLHELDKSMGQIRKPLIGLMNQISL